MSQSAITSVVVICLHLFKQFSLQQNPLTYYCKLISFECADRTWTT